MEEKRVLPLFDGKKLYGIWNAANGDEKSVVVLVHGWMSLPTDRIMHNAARFFKENGFATFRPGFYYHEEDSRRMEDCTMALHAQDLNVVIEHLRPQYEKLYLVGHSLGTIVVALADNAKADAIAFWDPTLQMMLTDDPYDIMEYVESLDAYLIKSSITSLQGKEMIEEFRNYDQSKVMAKVKSPIKCIYASDGGNGAFDWRAQYDLIPAPKETLMLPYDHSFTTEGAEERLFKETFDFLRKYT